MHWLRPSPVSPALSGGPLLPVGGGPNIHVTTRKVVTADWEWGSRRSCPNLAVVQLAVLAQRRGGISRGLAAVSAASAASQVSIGRSPQAL